MATINRTRLGCAKLQGYVEEECMSLHPELKRKEDELVIEGKRKEEQSNIPTLRIFINGKIIQDCSGHHQYNLEIDEERSSAAKNFNTANPFDALQVDELEDGEVPADTSEDLNNYKHEHHKEEIRQEHEELDFFEGTIDKKLLVQNITTNALMGREYPQYIKVT
ncbi:hypothetical protein H5410_021796 [Solanum commersonii]|uniref:Uncharacterized protein n=1 Tax=Solanum commersonii TaxID=4109 RepID=A0A9J5ZC17_SOLCO|nr:hypothetical protein H5410_021796 [Solanum commersonii]